MLPCGQTLWEKTLKVHAQALEDYLPSGPHCRPKLVKRVDLDLVQLHSSDQFEPASVIPMGGSSSTHFALH